MGENRLNQSKSSQVGGGFSAKSEVRIHDVSVRRQAEKA